MAQNGRNHQQTENPWAEPNNSRDSLAGSEGLSNSEDNATPDTQRLEVDLTTAMNDTMSNNVLPPALGSADVDIDNSNAYVTNTPIPTEASTTKRGPFGFIYSGLPHVMDSIMGLGRNNTSLNREVKVGEGSGTRQIYGKSSNVARRRHNAASSSSSLLSRHRQSESPDSANGQSQDDLPSDTPRIFDESTREALFQLPSFDSGATPRPSKFVSLYDSSQTSYETHSLADPDSLLDKDASSLVPENAIVTKPLSSPSEAIGGKKHSRSDDAEEYFSDEEVSVVDDNKRQKTNFADDVHTTRPAIEAALPPENSAMYDPLSVLADAATIASKEPAYTIATSNAHTASGPAGMYTNEPGQFESSETMNLTTEHKATMPKAFTVPAPVEDDLDFNAEQALVLRTAPAFPTVGSIQEAFGPLSTSTQLTLTGFVQSSSTTITLNGDHFSMANTISSTIHANRSLMTVTPLNDTLHHPDGCMDAVISTSEDVVPYEAHSLEVVPRAVGELSVVTPVDVEHIDIDLTNEPTMDSMTGYEQQPITNDELCRTLYNEMQKLDALIRNRLPDVPHSEENSGENWSEDNMRIEAGTQEPRSLDEMQIEQIVAATLAQQLPSLTEATRADSRQLENIVKSALEEKLPSVLKASMRAGDQTRTGNSFRDNDANSDQHTKAVLEAVLTECLPSLLKDQLPSAMKASRADEHLLGIVDTHLKNHIDCALSAQIPVAVKAAVDIQQLKASIETAIADQLSEIVKATSYNHEQLKSNLTSHFSQISEAAIKSAVADAISQATANPRQCDDEDAEHFDLSDEEDERKSKKRRRSSGKYSRRRTGVSSSNLQGKTKVPRDNQLNDALREHLTKKGVLLKKGESLPTSPPAELVRKFERDGVGGPELSEIKIDWLSSLSRSKWNSEAILLLASEFQQKIKRGDYRAVKYNEDTMNLKALNEKCYSRLVQVQMNIRKAPPETVVFTGATEVELWKKRRYSRRSGTFARRKRIIEDHSYLDPKLWHSIYQVIEELDVEGMSSDESDIEDPSMQLKDRRRMQKDKLVRRVRLPWLNSQISQLFEAVETYDALRPPGSVPDRRGNVSFPRLYNAIHASTERAARQCLPRNWYDDEWYRSSTNHAKLKLDAREDVEIPRLIPYTYGSSRSTTQEASGGNNSASASTAFQHSAADGDRT